MTVASYLNALQTHRRWLWRATAALCLVGTAVPFDRATAADWLGDPPLRGSFAPPTYALWEGWQFGVQAGLANMNSEFGNSTSSLVAFILRNTTIENEFAPSTWATLPADTTNGQVFGAFLAYNMQWDQLVAGFDLAYKYASSMEAAAADSISRQFQTSDGFDNQVSIDARATTRLVDYATLRARAGYAFGNFLPYAVIGAAVGRFNYATTVTVHTVGTPTGPGVPFNITTTSTSGKNNAFAAGLAAGLGVDWAVTPSLFLRAEWEYVAFAPINGARPNINTGQLGVGVRF
jgi:opacity protein-like surface antigen